MFNAKRFSLARRRRGLTKREVAERIGVSERSVSAYEKGDQEPEPSNMQRIAAALGFPEAFFFAGDPEELSEGVASFRSMSKMSARQRDSALGSGAIGLMLNEWLERNFNLPSPDLPDLGREPGRFTAPAVLEDFEEGIPFPSTATAYDPEAAAEALRSQWGLGELPVKNMIALLESKGVRVFSLAIDAKEVDAFSMWHGGTPFMFLNTYKSAEHCRFDAAHELGHLVLHRHGQTQGPELEREANAFASAFLMPRKSVLAYAPRVATLPGLVRAKHHWKVSVAALNYRMHALGLTSAWVYRTLCIQLAEAGYRTNEPEPMTHEKSQVLEKVFKALRDEGTSRADVAHALAISPKEIDSLTFNLMLNLLTGRGEGSRLRESAIRDGLHLIHTRDGSPSKRSKRTPPTRN
ncbi:XRE family transcriptional regulator [Burkholderia ubonensis]|uniref:helix-turn-helix domain-containing protein n=1 Tax=Burkholderia ubonensis TaxID=101571 RepID=UPI00075AB4E5|nr:XRE family transcriptional regulator [Burkholderia ubonensis]KVR14080.1 XRE family transcriptional regulator [Burkholderia ubonensis]